jgi:hypothetical protein
MSGTQVSSWGDPNILYKALSGQGVREQQALDDTHVNALLNQQTTQANLNTLDLEMIARASAYLNTLPEDQRATAYPGIVSQLQQSGFAKNAPSIYPGHERIAQLAAMGTPSKELMEIGEGRAWANAQRPVAAAPAPGAAPGVAAPAPGVIEPDAQTRAFAVRDGLIRRGMDPETATAFAANALHESSANPNTGPGDRGASHGLFQWRDDRAARYQQLYGHAPDNAPLDEQLDFVMHELSGPESLAKGRIAAAQGAADKAAEVSAAYLRPKDVQAEMQRRRATAQQLAGSLPNVTPGMGDQAWLDQMTRQYPSLGGPNANPNQPAPYQVATAGNAVPPPPTGAPAISGGQGLVRNPDGTVSTPNAGGLATPGTTAAAGGSPGAPAVPAPPAAAPAAAAPPFTPPKPVNANGLTVDQQRSMDALLPSAARTREGRANWTAKVEQLKQQNETEQRQYETNVNTWQNQQATAARAEQTAAQTAANQAAHLDLARRADQRAQQEADDKAREKGETLVPGQGIEAVHENTLQKYAAKMARGEQLTEDEQRLYDGAYYAMQQSGGQTGTMTDPNNPGQQIPFQTTRRLPPNLPEPKGGALPPVISQPGAPKKDQMTEGQGQAAAFADRMALANPIMENLDQNALTWGQTIKQRAGDFVGYTITSPNYQKLRTAQEAFLAGILRKESGAAVSPSEWERYAKLYFPQPGESTETIQLKRQFRQTAMEGMQREAGPTYKPPTGATSTGGNASTPPPPPGFRVVQ